MIPLYLLSFVGGVGYLIWMVVTAVKRRWRRLAYQAAAAVAYVGLLFLLDSWHYRYAEAQYFRGLFGVAGKLPDPTFSYDSERAFNGDGYSLAAFVLPPAVKAQFQSFGETMAAYPQRPDYRSHWKTSPWRKTPSASSDKRYIDFALTSSFGSNVTLEHQKAIRVLLSRDGSFFAYFYNEFEGYLGDIDLFVVDPANDRLYLINFNT